MIILLIFDAPAQQRSNANGGERKADGAANTCTCQQVGSRRARSADTKAGGESDDTDGDEADPLIAGQTLIARR
ncbi:MAG: hypothetical protein AAFN03_11315 [Pseudomonadota bacterium]